MPLFKERTSKILNKFIGPKFLKKGFDIILTNKHLSKMLSIIIANYFLSTIVADQTASAIFF